ncbi:unnamed protein product [Trifolium pratense]|uniref:Uncharacterized protein n=1 Tax=Trifolium pratense TaxID=57577 RepID=A0ACB0L364_TRIPR|nr:unnamed protein product [Trifolium pratense]
MEFKPKLVPELIRDQYKEFFHVQKLSPVLDIQVVCMLIVVETIYSRPGTSWMTSSINTTARDLTSSSMPEIYTTARAAPILLTYFHYCLKLLVHLKILYQFKVNDSHWNIHLR